MEIYHIETPADIPVTNIFIALGTFDGVHLGHKKVLETAVEQAKKTGAKAGVLTFQPHPLSILKPDRAPHLITSYEEKEKLIGEMGPDILLIQNFNTTFADIAYNSFIKKYLVEGLKVNGIVVGQNFQFGRNAQGNSYKLAEAGKHYGFSTIVLDPLKVDGEKISSSLIRNLVKNGEVDKVPSFLGRHFSIRGVIRSGTGQGKNLGFPTANVHFTTAYILPRLGVYAALVKTDCNINAAVVNFGQRPTFNKGELILEAHLIDVNENLYGKTIEVRFCHFLRQEKQFPNKNNLCQQIIKDKDKTRELLQNDLSLH